MKTTQMKPYGIVRTQEEEYLLLSPFPVVRDSPWDNGTYTFFVAREMGGEYYATQLVTNSFSHVLDDNMPVIDVINNMPEEKAVGKEMDLYSWVSEPIEEDVPPLEDPEDLGLLEDWEEPPSSEWCGDE